MSTPPRMNTVAAAGDQRRFGTRYDDNPTPQLASTPPQSDRHSLDSDDEQIDYGSSSSDRRATIGLGLTLVRSYIFVTTDVDSTCRPQYLHPGTREIPWHALHQLRTRFRIQSTCSEATRIHLLSAMQQTRLQRTCPRTARRLHLSQSRLLQQGTTDETSPRLNTH